MLSDGEEYNNNKKRSLDSISPEQVDAERKLRRFKASPVIKSPDTSMDEIISKLDQLLDRKLKNIATKEDLSVISKEVNALRTENQGLKKEMDALKSNSFELHQTVRNQQKKLEILEKKAKRNNVVVSGLAGGTYNEITAEIDDILANVLNVEVKRLHVSKLNKEGTRCCVELETTKESQLILKNSGKLKGTNKYIRRDWTQTEDKCRYHVRSLRRACMRKEGTNCRLAGGSIIIDGKQFTASEDGSFMAKDEESAGYLQNILREVNEEINVCHYRPEQNQNTEQ